MRTPGPRANQRHTEVRTFATTTNALLQLRDWLIDAGTCRVKAASSVVDLSHYPFTITREGAISRRTLEKTLFR